MAPLSARTIRHARQAASLWSAAAVGALLFSVRVATTVFRDIPEDRLLAGRIAGRAFVGAYAIATTAGLVATIVACLTTSRRSAVDRVLAVALLGTALVELFWIAPAIMRHGVGWPGSFASLHAVGGVLHVALAAIALILAWRLLAADEASR